MQKKEVKKPTNVYFYHPYEKTKKQSLIKNMPAYINGLSCVSHYNTADKNFFFEGTPTIPAAKFLSITSPNYKDYIPAAAIRRTSHILKMGISAGLMCLKEEEKSLIDAIIVGTAVGCYEDTDKFLRSLLDNNEQTLAPTSFIQSTHNTLGGQLALLLKCQGYNFTYVHQNFSFEYALLDALMLLQEHEAKHILLGGADELSNPLPEIYERAGHIKHTENLDQKIELSTSKGYAMGEGAAFFHVVSEKTNESVAKIEGVKILSEIPSAKNLLEQTEIFLNENQISFSEIDLILSGINGDASEDLILKEFGDLSNKTLGTFKNLCGEYFTASAFALWLAARMIEKQKIPEAVLYKGVAPTELKHMLIVNHHKGNSYSLMCVSKC